MKIVNLISKIPCVVIFLYSSLFLSSCSTPYHKAAIISSINDYQNSYRTQQIVNRIIKNDDTCTTTMSSSRCNLSSYSGPSIGVLIPIATRKICMIYNRDYSKIPKGRYNASTYTVQYGDTLFYISYITGSDFRKLAFKNNIPAPYSLQVGQIVNISDENITSSRKFISNSLYNNQCSVDLQTTNACTENVSVQESSKILTNNKQPIIQNSTEILTKTDSVMVTKLKNSINSSSITWRWPAKGKIIETFSDAPGGNRGFDLAGLRGQFIRASAPGKVVYAGNALRGYGNLIIIKHNNDYLSAYAHNDTLLVHDQQTVFSGQEIATMGKTDSSVVKLHFEIRYKGESVNPLFYLPTQQRG